MVPAEIDLFSKKAKEIMKSKLAGKAEPQSYVHDDAQFNQLLSDIHPEEDYSYGSKQIENLAGLKFGMVETKGSSRGQLYRTGFDSDESENEDTGTGSNAKEPRLQLQEGLQ
jgi:hypothetical protein